MQVCQNNFPPSGYRKSNSITILGRIISQWEMCWQMFFTQWKGDRGNQMMDCKAWCKHCSFFFKSSSIMFFLRSWSTSSSGNPLLPRVEPDTLDPTRLNSTALLNCMTMSLWSVNTDCCVLLFFGSFCKQVPDLSFSCHREAATSKMAIWNKHIASHELIKSQATSLIEAPLF